jgi:hypothetical protein
MIWKSEIGSRFRIVGNDRFRGVRKGVVRATPIEQWTTGLRSTVEHLADHDLVIAAVVDPVDGALDPRYGAIENGRIARSKPVAGWSNRFSPCCENTRAIAC